MQKRLIVLLFFIFSFTCVNAQIISLKWTGTAMVLDSNFVPKKILSFAGSVTRKDLLPSYTLTLHNVAARNFRLVDARYQTLADSEKVAVQNKQLPPIITSVTVQNNRPQTIVSFVPLRVNNQTGEYEKLVSFSYSYEATDFVVPAAGAKKTKSSQSYANAKTAAAGFSVLSSGSWYRIAVSSTGMFKLDYNFFKSMGINPDNIDPRYIRLFGNGGGMLPQSNGATRADDLMENTIYVAGEADGNFGSDDYVLFYAKGPDNWTYNTVDKKFNHNKNIYSDKSYYFITIGPSLGARVQNESDLGSAAQVMSYFDDYVFHENDLYNILGSGREWYGETFENPSATYSFNSTGLLAASQIKITSSLMSRSVSSTGFALSIN